MTPDWRLEVATLLADVASNLRSRNDHQAVVAFGTAIGYLQKMKEAGEKVAAELCSQIGTSQSAREQGTERFTFAPGELEAMKRDSKR